MGMLGGGGGGDPPPKPDGHAMQEASTINLIENERNMTLLPTPVIDDPPWSAATASCLTPGAIPSLLTQGLTTPTCNAPDFLNRIHSRAGQLLNSLNYGTTGIPLDATYYPPRTASARARARHVSNLASLVDNLRYGGYGYGVPPPVHVHYHG